MLNRLGVTLTSCTGRAVTVVPFHRATMTLGHAARARQPGSTLPPGRPNGPRTLDAVGTTTRAPATAQAGVVPDDLPKTERGRGQVNAETTTARELSCSTSGELVASRAYNPYYEPNTGCERVVSESVSSQTFR
jgi:hypothetical protein